MKEQNIKKRGGGGGEDQRKWQYLVEKLWNNDWALRHIAHEYFTSLHHINICTMIFKHCVRSLYYKVWKEFRDNAAVMSEVWLTTKSERNFSKFAALKSVVLLWNLKRNIRELLPWCPSGCRCHSSPFLIHFYNLLISIIIKITTTCLK